MTKSHIVAISLRNVQARFKTFHPRLNVRAMIPRKYYSTLEYLDVSRNYLQYVNFDALQFPNLVILNVSQNMFAIPSLSYENKPVFLLELASLHPFIQVIDFGRQNGISTTMCADEEMKEGMVTSVSTHDTDVKRQTQSYESINSFNLLHVISYLECLSKLSTTLNDVILNQTVFASFVNCALNRTVAIPSKLISSLDTLMNETCNIGIAIPIAPNLHDVRLDHAYSDIFKWYYDSLKKSFCLSLN